MSNADPEEVVTASSDGVSVEKSFEPDDFPVPAIAFVVESKREEAVTVRLVDSVPSHVPPEDIGFHPKYGAEFWGVEDDTIVFEREFEPEEEYTTVYGLRGGDAEDAEEFMSEPEFDSIDPPLKEDDAGGDDTPVVGGSVDDESTDNEPADEPVDGDAGGVAAAVEEVDTGLSEDGDEGADEIDIPDDIGGASDDGITVDDDEADASEDDVSVGDVSSDDATAVEDSTVEDSAAEDSAAEEADDSGPTDAGPTGVGATASTGGTAVSEGESLAAALAAEIRSGDVDDEDVEDLRDALGVDLASASVGARIEHIQSEVADLQAYTDALEEFLDENGDAQRVLDDVQAGLEDVREDVEAADERVDDVETTAETAADDAEELSEELESFREEIGEATDERIEDLEADVAELEAELDDVAEMRDRLTSALGGLTPQSDAADSGSDDRADDTGRDNATDEDDEDDLDL